MRTQDSYAAFTRDEGEADAMYVRPTNGIVRIDEEMAHLGSQPHLARTPPKDLDAEARRG